MNRRVFFLAAPVFLLAAALSWGGAQAEGAGAAGTARNWDPFEPYEETVVLTQGRTYQAGHNLPEGDSYSNNVYTRYVEDRVNVRVENKWELEGDAHHQRVSLAIASGDMPDVLVANHQAFMQMLESDIIEDLTEVYDRTLAPFLKERYASFGGNRCVLGATFDGKLMAFPETHIGGDHNLLWVREDWRTALGLDEPETLDDIIAVAREFIDNDMSGTGDTVGLTAKVKISGQTNSMHGLDTVFSLYGAYPRQWVRDDRGEVVFGSVAPEMKPALAKVREMYADGIIDNQFVVRDQNELIASGKVGMIFGAWWAPWWPLVNSVGNDSSIDWKPYAAPVDEKGEVRVYGQNPVGNYLVVKKGIEHPEAVAKVLNAQYTARWGLDPAIKDESERYFELNVGWGVIPFAIQMDYEDEVDRRYQKIMKAIEKGSPDGLMEEHKAWYRAYMEAQDMDNLGADKDLWATVRSVYDGQDLAYDDRNAFIYPVFYGQTKTMATKWATLEKLHDEMLLKIILGEEPLERFDSFVSEWKRLGGDQITAEVRDLVD